MAVKTTTTAEPATTTTTVPPPYSFDGSVPPPELVNTGTDYEAMYRSFIAYGDWLLAHRPEAALLPEMAVQGTAIYDSYGADIDALSSDDRRLFDTDTTITAVDVISVKPNAVSLVAEFAQMDAILIARDGREVDHKTLPASVSVVALLTPDATGRWRLASQEYQ